MLAYVSIRCSLLPHYGRVFIAILLCLALGKEVMYNTYCFTRSAQCI